MQGKVQEIGAGGTQPSFPNDVPSHLSSITDVGATSANIAPRVPPLILGGSRLVNTVTRGVPGSAGWMTRGLVAHFQSGCLAFLSHRHPLHLEDEPSYPASLALSPPGGEGPYPRGAPPRAESWSELVWRAVGDQREGGVGPSASSCPGWGRRSLHTLRSQVSHSAAGNTSPPSLHPPTAWKRRHFVGLLDPESGENMNMSMQM